MENEKEEKGKYLKKGGSEGIYERTRGRRGRISRRGWEVQKVTHGKASGWLALEGGFFEGNLLRGAWTRHMNEASAKDTRKPCGGYEAVKKREPGSSKVVLCQDVRSHEYKVVKNMHEAGSSKVVFC
ncbi:hypothetical protein Salat_1613400 [Sesamum alatum]|uniref:Uncharacterized protein n=1 Tax=Sesamum alatum TaxID=300844 RepID=A0AAE1Y5Y5_9LAMI|nr:hypothetical protein Salat_1613400 [Sesamum alatum]